MKRQPAFALSILLVTTVALISHAIAQSDQATSSAELTAATSEQWGEHLVTGDGMSVYLYVLDEDGTLACVDACLNNWPPLLVEEGEEPNLGDGVDPELVGTIERADGELQLTYGGHPLYTYRRDTEPGHTRGQRLGDQFFLVSLGGEAVSEEIVADAVELPEEEMTALMSEGAQAYRSNCAVCHGAEGQGGIGPGFVGNSQLSNTNYVVNRILDGFIDHGMPPFAGVLSDRQIAAVSTHIRNSWGNDFGPVLEEEVAQER